MPKRSRAQESLSSEVPTPIASIAKEEAAAKRSKVILAHLEMLAGYLPKSVRRPLLWIGATLLALPILFGLLRIATGGAESAYLQFLQRPAPIIIVGVVLALVVLAGTIEAAVKRRTKEAESQRYAKRVDSLANVPENTGSEDSALLAKDSIIVDTVREDERRARGAGKPHFDSRIIAVVSGKGGVGKSVIALGLLEDFSRDEKALLVDFDLHNRGLTSLLLDSFGTEEHDYVIDLLKAFLDEPGLGELLQAYSASKPTEIPPSLTDKFRKLTLKYSGIEPHASDRRIGLLNMSMLPELPAPRLVDPLNASNAFLLPSIPLGGSFLGSRKIRDASEDAAFLFFKALSYRARVQNGIQNLIIDCHGAHDLYTVGLIRAATDLVIVTTPDMGSLEGTRELIRFGKNVTEAGENKLPRSLLVANRCIENDPNAKQLEKKWKEDLTGGVIRIQRDDAVERVSRNYLFGSLASKSGFWKHIEAIKAALQP